MTPLGTRGSFFVGLVCGLVAVVLGVVLSQGAPEQSTDLASTTGAWVASGDHVTFVPFTSPLPSPILARTQDGFVVAIAERFDRAPRYERFDPPSSRFVPLATRPPLDTDPGQPRNEWAVRIAGAHGEWFYRPEGEPTRLVKLGISPDAGARGPLCKGRWIPDFVLAIDAERLVAIKVLGEGPELYVARRDDAELRAVPFQPVPAEGVVAAGAAGGERVLLFVRDGTTRQLATRMVDVDTGAVTEGPPLPGKLAKARMTAAFGKYGDDGTVVVLASEDRPDGSWRAGGVPIPVFFGCAIAWWGMMIALVVMVVWKRLALVSTAKGFAAGASGTLIVGVGLFLNALSHVRW